MDAHFGASPAQPGSVMSSLFGGQTPASATNPNNYIIGEPSSVFAHEPLSVFNATNAAFMSSIGPNSVLNATSIGGPGM